MTKEIENSILEIAQQSRAASRKLSGICKASKNDALQKIAHELESNRKFLIEENEKDLNKAKEDQLSEAMMDRLRLTHERIDGMAQGLRQLIDLPLSLIHI